MEDTKFPDFGERFKGTVYTFKGDNFHFYSLLKKVSTQTEVSSLTKCRKQILFCHFMSLLSLCLYFTFTPCVKTILSSIDKISLLLQQ